MIGNPRGTWNVILNLADKSQQRGCDVLLPRKVIFSPVSIRVIRLCTWLEGDVVSTLPMLCNEQECVGIVSIKTHWHMVVSIVCCSLLRSPQPRFSLVPIKNSFVCKTSALEKVLWDLSWDQICSYGCEGLLGVSSFEFRSSFEVNIHRIRLRITSSKPTFYTENYIDRYICFRFICCLFLLASSTMLPPVSWTH